MKLSHIAQTLGCALPQQYAEREIKGIASLESAGKGDITFLADPRFIEKARATRAAAIIVKTGMPLKEKPCLEVADPYAGYARAAQLFENRAPLFGEGIAESVVADPSAQIESGVSIGPGSVIGADCVIGEKTRIGARCVIENGCCIGADCRIDSGAVIRWGCRIGCGVVIQSGAVIGSDGFGNARTAEGFVRIPCFGIVVIEDEADIGAGTTIDRGNFEPTVIGRGVKLDNLIHIAHNVTIGEHTAIAAQTGISGSTKVGARVLIGGQAGFVGHIGIGDDAFVGAKAGVSKDVAPGARVTGCPARDFMTMRRIEAAEANFPQMLKEIKRLRREIDELKSQ